MFRMHLSEECRSRLDQEASEANRLYRLTNQWLASALLKLAREARKSTTLRPDDCTYDSSLVWGVVPELARRLGRVKLEVAEIDWEVRDLTNYELRCRIGATLGNVAERSSAAWLLLTRTPVNGNPVAYGADRLQPGVVGDRQDRLTCAIAEVARCRGVAYSGVWSPALTPG
ncbi:MULTISPECIES: hypothetical protein [unclassified Variovorax]|uniref:hypothetical protein n=1 Tax=unclassified Variovorax TaxID=663243 RepID=UPI000838AEB6|nr:MULTISPECIES: hypothetical protein [unclassified Variovorax]PNG50151.1 hypothetical protein CHC06_05774 [Variovorax sp. B2]PNG51024.1 hypothetical protein CHC07_05680 [Variovorax sp. B4]VTU42093.1 hypothetical protein SRS16P1_00191 [Variovorax sp. SRS16]VTU42131.1 hypothetical protein E5P1_00189 [Variovorax sp. PBL-E5]VTU44369.1 hypothetical protein H6P1_00742 [Variovorax sp. PBL-H6]